MMASHSKTNGWLFVSTLCEEKLLRGLDSDLTNNQEGDNQKIELVHHKKAYITIKM